MLSFMLEKRARVDVAEFLWKKFLESLEEAESSELSAFTTLFSYFHNIKLDMINRGTLERICSIYCNTLLDLLYDLNELLGECRILANRVKQLDQSLSRLISLYKFLFWIRRRVKPELTRIRKEFEGLAEWAQRNQVRSEYFGTVRHTSSTSKLKVDVSEIIEFDAHVEKIENLLLGKRSDDDDVGFTGIGIVGMGGVGKTTLVQKTFNSPIVQKEFSKKVWICASDLLKEQEEVDIRVKIIKYIFKELGHDLTDDDEVTTDELGHANFDIVDLLKKLNSFLSSGSGNGNGRYLLVLDDVCHTHEFLNYNYKLGERKEECLNLWNWLPKDKDCNGAVIVTSRKYDVAEFMVGDNNNLVHLEPLSKESCWKIFQNTLHQNGKIRLDHPALAKIKDEIEEQCHGLPLAAKALANFILKRERLSQEGTWNFNWCSTWCFLSEAWCPRCMELKQIHSPKINRMKELDLGSKKQAIEAIEEEKTDPPFQGIKKQASDAIKEERTDPPFQGIKNEIEGMTAMFEEIVSKWNSCSEAIKEERANPLPINNKRKLINRIGGDIKHISKLVTPWRLINIDLEREMDQYQPEETSAKEVSQKWQKLYVEKEFFEVTNMEKLRASYYNLENLQLKLCLLFLSIFPENSVIKKRPLIYWWIGEGLIKAQGAKTAEEVGEEIFVKLIAESLIIAKFDNQWNWSHVVNRCQVHPWIRHMLMYLAEEAQLFDCRSMGRPYRYTLCRRACLDGKSYSMSDQEAAKLLTVFNVDEGYPSFSDVNWLKKLTNVVTLQLGRWQDSVKHHIEMEDNILKDLGAQKHLKYLSLRGLSRITALPDSIVNLISLEILDLRACHNLERLPNKIESLRKLTHLDVSKCYLLESMPKGLEKLPALQVLKGFVVGDSNETSCRIGSLHNLDELKRLSIRIGRTAKIRNEEFEKLSEITSLRCLTISWGKCHEDELPSLSFPSDLQKLDLRGIPIEEATNQWLQPSKLTKLKKLYIRGGELTSLNCKSPNNGGTGSWQVEILILKYLRHLKIELSELQEKFPHLRYLEKIKCHEDDEDVVWDKSKGRLWPKEEKQRHDVGESGASSSKS